MHVLQSLSDWGHWININHQQPQLPEQFVVMCSSACLSEAFACQCAATERHSECLLPLPLPLLLLWRVGSPFTPCPHLGPLYTLSNLSRSGLCALVLWNTVPWEISQGWLRKRKWIDFSTTLLFWWSLKSVTQKKQSWLKWRSNYPHSGSQSQGRGPGMAHTWQKLWKEHILDSVLSYQGCLWDKSWRWENKLWNSPTLATQFKPILLVSCLLDLILPQKYTRHCVCLFSFPSNELPSGSFLWLKWPLCFWDTLYASYIESL